MWAVGNVSIGDNEIQVNTTPSRSGHREPGDDVRVFQQIEV